MVRYSTLYTLGSGSFRSSFGLPSQTEALAQIFLICTYGVLSFDQMITFRLFTFIRIPEILFVIGRLTIWVRPQQVISFDSMLNIIMMFNTEHGIDLKQAFWVDTSLSKKTSSTETSLFVSNREDLA